MGKTTPLAVHLAARAPVTLKIRVTGCLRGSQGLLQIQPPEDLVGVVHGAATGKRDHQDLLAVLVEPPSRLGGVGAVIIGDPVGGYVPAGVTVRRVGSCLPLGEAL